MLAPIHNTLADYTTASKQVLANNGAGSMSKLPEGTLQTHILEADIRDGLEFFVRDPGPIQSKTCIAVTLPNGDVGRLDIVSEEEAGKSWLTKWKGPDVSEHDGKIFLLILLEDRESQEGEYHRLRKYEVELVDEQ